jgi:hypothetical protein
MDPTADEVTKILLEEIHDQEVRKLIEPILNVFGGADGGVAFSRLRFEILPQLLKIQDTDQRAADAYHAFEVVSRSCQVMLDAVGGSKAS